MSVRKAILRAVFSPKRRERLWSFWYDYLNRRFDQRPVWFLNYGLSPEDGGQPALAPEDEPNRISIQLYHRVAAAIDLSDTDVLEVSCGRGGGARYVQQYLHPARLVALDFSREGLVRCARQHAGRPIHFVCGDALHLPFPDGSFDAVINVEASHCYPDLAKFLSQVRRVLRPGGHLLYADLRRERQYGPWREEILRSGLTLLEEENLTPHVARALDASNERTTALVREVAPRLLRRAMMRFAGTRSSEVYRGLRSGSIRYARFVLRK